MGVFFFHMAKLAGANDLEKLHSLCAKTYKEQAIWFLNSFWEEFAQKEAETIWNYVGTNAELDLENHADGCGLDEMKVHVFLEKFNETLTVREMRAKLRSTGAIGEAERPKTVPLTHYLLFNYNADWHALVNASQGDNSKEIAQAQEMLDKVTAAFEEAKRTAAAAAQAHREAEASAAKAKQREEESKAAAERSKQREIESKAAAESARAAEDDARAAQAELEAALAEVKAQEDAYNSKTEDLKKKSETGGVVSRNKAANELAQHLAEDPLPLRKAKITAEAAVKRSEKATKAAATARTNAEAAANNATQARAEAETAAKEATQAREAADRDRDAAAKAKATADAALEDAEQKLAEAEAFLEEVKSRPGCAHGAVWWIERELHEQKRYLPESKGGIRR